MITKSDKAFYNWWQSQFTLSPPENIIQVNSIEACIQMVSQGPGWNILPKIHVANKRSLCFHPLIWPDGQSMLQKTVMAYRGEPLAQPAVKVFVDYLLNEYNYKNI